MRLHLYLLILAISLSAVFASVTEMTDKIVKVYISFCLHHKAMFYHKVPYTSIFTEGLMEMSKYKAIVSL